MAKKIMKSAITLSSWQECDDALRAIGEHQRDIAAIETVLNEQISAAKAAAEAKARPILDQVEHLELAIRAYVYGHRQDMGAAKTKKLNFGSVSFRRSKKIKLPSGAEKLRVIIDQLRVRKMHECIVQKPPTIDKEALKKYPDEDIVAVGASIIVDEQYKYSVDMEKIK